MPGKKIVLSHAHRTYLAREHFCTVHGIIVLGNFAFSGFMNLAIVLCSFLAKSILHDGIVTVSLCAFMYS